MTLSLNEISERIDTLEGENRAYRKHADEMELMWRLVDDSPGMEAARNTRGQEAVVLPTPYNIVTLAERMFSNLPRIKVPSAKGEVDDDDKARKRSRWLAAYWQRANREYSLPVMGNLVWQSLVLGRHCLRVRWIRDDLPKALRDRRLPIMLDTPDPRCTFVDEDWRGTCFASHGYRQRWRSLWSFYKQYEVMRPPDESRADEWVETRDVWWLDDDGNVWNSVLASLPQRQETYKRGRARDVVYAMEFLKPPTQTDYPEVPIIVGYGDSAPLDDSMTRGLSLLYPIQEMWRYNNRLASGTATALLWNFNPFVWLENTSGATVPPISVEPGTIQELPLGVKPQQMTIQNNMSLMQAQMSLVDAAIQQSAFPSVMYGEAGGLTAGYPMQILAQQARGRTNKIRQNLERTLEKGNALMLAMIEVDIWGGDEGVKIWAEDEARGLYSITLKASDIQQYYENSVTLVPDVPEDNAQKIATWLRMVETQVISRQTFRDLVLETIGLPQDEDVRVMIETALQDPQMQGKAILRALQKYYPNRAWELMVAGTQYEQIAQQEEQWKLQNAEMKKQERLAKATQRFRETGKVPDGYLLMPDGNLISEKDIQAAPPMSGMSMPPPAAMPGGAPGMPMGQPPMSGPPMNQPGPAMSGPPMMPSGMGAPQDTSGAMQVPGMMGMSPELAGQMQPENMGLPPNLEGVDPMLFQQLVGGRLGPADEMRRIAGIA